jgi:hypothetical protein
MKVHGPQGREDRPGEGGYFPGNKEPPIRGKPGQGRGGKAHRFRPVSGAVITHGHSRFRRYPHHIPSAAYVTTGNSGPSEQPVALVDFYVTSDAKIPVIRHVLAVCTVKNRLKGDFLRFYARRATNCEDAGKGRRYSRPFFRSNVKLLLLGYIPLTKADLLVYNIYINTKNISYRRNVWHERKRSRI